MKRSIILLITGIVTFSCVSKKKFVELEQAHNGTKSELVKSQVINEELNGKLTKIQERVDRFNEKINSLTEEAGVLAEENDKKFIAIDGAIISNQARRSMNKTLEGVDSSKLTLAKSLKDSMNIAVTYNLEKAVNLSDLEEPDDILVNVEDAIMQISISDKMLFRSGSYKISPKANKILQKLADVIKSEPSIDVMIEGHTDAKGIKSGFGMKDNWDLSVLRATSVVRMLQGKYGVSPDKLIASGRSSYQPISDNESNEGRSRNRRTRIIILPNIDKFFAMMASN